MASEEDLIDVVKYMYEKGELDKIITYHSINNEDKYQHEAELLEGTIRSCLDEGYPWPQIPVARAISVCEDPMVLQTIILLLIIGNRIPIHERVHSHEGEVE